MRRARNKRASLLVRKYRRLSVLYGLRKRNSKLRHHTQSGRVELCKKSSRTRCMHRLSPPPENHTRVSKTKHLIPTQNHRVSITTPKYDTQIFGNSHIWDPNQSVPSTRSCRRALGHQWVMADPSYIMRALKQTGLHSRLGGLFGCSGSRI